MSTRIDQLKKSIEDLENPGKVVSSHSSITDSTGVKTSKEKSMRVDGTVGESKDNREWFVKEILCLKKILSRGFQEMSQEELNAFVKIFSKCRRDCLSEVISAAYMANRFPLPSELYDDYVRIVKKNSGTGKMLMIDGPPIGETQAEESAFMAMMFVHYKFGVDVSNSDSVVKYCKLSSGDRISMDYLRDKFSCAFVTDWIEKKSTKTTQTENSRKAFVDDFEVPNYGIKEIIEKRTAGMGIS